MFASLNLGIGLVIAGLVFVILVWGALRLLPRGPVPAHAEAQPLPPEAARADEGVLVIQTGGRVEYVNPRAREWFDLREGDPADFERLLRRVRPPDDFLEVCAVPGQKRLNVNGRPVEVTSYQVPGAYPQMLVSLRSLELAPSFGADGSGLASSILRVVTDFSRSITSSLDLESVLRSVIDSTLRLVAADILEIKIWDQVQRGFVAYRFEETNGSGPKLVSSLQGRFGSVTDTVIQSRLPVLLADLAALVAEHASDPAGITSYLGVPLIAGGELVGILEAGQTSGPAFTHQELDLLQLVSAQTAAALRNAMLYEHERRRGAELAGLAGLAQAVSAIREPEELFTRLVESITPLFDADILGFILYDENQRVLAGQVPFRGLPRQIVEIYRTRIAPGSAAEALLREPAPILTSNAAADNDWRALGLTDVAVAASLRDSALIPLVSQGRMLGYLQLSHRPQGVGEFSDSDLSLLQIVSEQAAAIIDNALWVRKSSERVRRSEALRRISDLSASSTAVDAALSFTLKELAGLFEANLAAAFVLDEARGQLRLHGGSAVGLSPQVTTSYPGLVVDQPEYFRTVTGSQRPLISGRLSVDTELLAFYRPLVSGMGLESAAGIPLTAHGRPFGELWLGSTQTEFFGDQDLELLTTAGASLASTMEGLRLATQTDESLRHRVDQLTAIARVSRELGASLALDHLLKVLHDETIHATGADCGSILLVPGGEIGADPRRLSSTGCPHGEELTLLERRALEGRQSFTVAEFAREGLPAPHSGVRSGLFVPIVEGGRAVGLIQVHAARTAAFGGDALETAQTLAIQAAVALANAREVQAEHRQSEVLRRRAESLEKYSAASYSLNPDLPLEESLTSLSQGIRDATPFRAVLISLYEPETRLLRRVAGAGFTPEALAELQAHKQPLSNLQPLLRPEFKIGRAYCIPADRTPLPPPDLQGDSTSRHAGADAKQNPWDPNDLVVLPLEDMQRNLLGLISLEDPSDGRRPDRATIEAVELFAVQAIQVLHHARRLGDMNSRIESLTAGLNRQQQLLSVTQNDLPVLLRKDLEQTIALHSLDRRAQRVRAGLAITESLSRQLDTSSALLALARETLTQLGMSIALVAENTAEGSRLAHVLGAVPGTINTEALFGQRNPLRTSLQTGTPILVPDLDQNDEWRDTPLLRQLRARGVICLPVMVENRPVAAMMALTAGPLPPFTEEDRQVYFQISRQASVVLQNISLLNETRRRLHEVNILLDFSRRLGGMDPSQIVQALLESARHALAAAHAGVVLLWNEQTASLEPRAASGYADDDSMMKVTYQRGEALPGAVYESGEPRRVDELNFATDYVLSPEKLGQYRRATGGRLPVSSLLLPILVEEQGTGLIVLDNFNTPAAFRPEDEALMVSLSQQAALSLENVRLLHALTERAGQLEGLNEVATAMSSSLRSDQLAGALLDQLSLLLPFDTVTLWLRDGERFSVAAARGFPDTEKRLGQAVTVGESPLFREMVENERPISVADTREDARFPKTEAPRLSWLGLPLVAKGQLTGLIALEKWQAGFYSREQIQLGTTLASQAAIALENASLYEDSLRRASELDERSKRLALLNRFSSALSGLLDAGQILQLTTDEMQRALHASRVAAVTFERQQAFWATATPRSRQKLPQRLSEAPIFARLREAPEVFSTDNARSETDLAPLRDFIGQDARGLLVLPLGGGEDLLALLFVHNPTAERFPGTEIELARTVANQAYIALENARLYHSTVQTAEHLSLLHQASAEIGSSLDPEAIYASIHRAAASLMPLDGFVISLLDEDGQQVEAVYVLDQQQRISKKRVRVGQGLGSRVIQSGEPVLLSSARELAEFDGLSLNPQAVSALGMPLMLGERAIGMLSPRSRQPSAYTAEHLQILGTLANQAAITIQNARLFGETQRLARELEQRVAERTAQLRHEQQNTETLLRILTEVSASLDLDRALNRTLALLNDAVRAEQGTIMLLNPEDDLLHYRAGYGYLSDRVGTAQRETTFKVGEGLAGWVVQNREAALVADVQRDPRWTPTSSATRENRSAIVAPLLVGDDVIGVLMVFSRAEAYFSEESLALVKAIANQVAVAINNARLYELIRDQAERLGSMLRKEQEEASRSQAILEAVADGVLVTGPDNRMTFLNTSVERILGVQASQFLGQSLEEFGGLFGAAGSTWLEAIRRWSSAPATYEAGDTYAEHLELGDGRIALVHLAPVILEGDFLGTVSILRDITHEVEVDRLKSEFVATVSHELRTPMTSIKGYVEMLLMGAAGAINENQSHFLDIVKKNIDRLNSLVDDLLDVSRIEAGKVTLAPQPMDLRQMAQDALGEMRRKSDEDKKPMAFSLKAPRALPRALGDPDRVRQILLSLLDNAYHYTPENGSIQVSLRALKKPGEIQVDVIDNGLGIPAADQQRVFERFFRGDDPLVLATPGTGLGLSIVRQLVEMHRGRIWVTSEGVSGKGSSFSFTLPVAEGAEAAGAVAGTPGPSEDD